LNLKLYHNITKIKSKLLPKISDVMNTNNCISRFSILFFSTLWQMQRSMEWNRVKIEWDAQKLISQNIFRLTSVSQQLRIPFGNVRMFSEKPLSRNRVYNEKCVGLSPVGFCQFHHVHRKCVRRISAAGVYTLRNIKSDDIETEIIS